MLLVEKYKKYGSQMMKAKQAFVEEIEDEVKAGEDNFAAILKSLQMEIEAISKEAKEFSCKVTALYEAQIYQLDVGLPLIYLLKVELTRWHNRKRLAIWKESTWRRRQPYSMRAMLQSCKRMCVTFLKY
jgi:hypothetical protein